MLPLHNYFFNLQEVFFSLYAIGVAGHGTVAADDAVAGDDDGYWVVADGLSHGLCRTAADASGYVAIGCRLTIRDVHEGLPYAMLEGGSDRLQRQQEIGTLPREIYVEPSSTCGEWSVISGR